MFEDSLIESGGKLKTKRGWTSIVSFAIQIMIVGVMVLIPLIFTEALPKGTTLFMLVAPRRLRHHRLPQLRQYTWSSRFRPTSSTANCALRPRFPKKLR